MKKKLFLLEHNRIKQSSEIYKSITQNATSFFSDMQYSDNGWELSNSTKIIDEDAQELFDKLYQENILQFLYERHDANVLSNSIIKQHTWFSEFYYFYFVLCFVALCEMRIFLLLMTLYLRCLVM